MKRSLLACLLFGGVAVAATGVTYVAHADGLFDEPETNEKIVRTDAAPFASGSASEDFVTKGITDEAGAAFHHVLASGASDPLMLPINLPPRGVPAEANFLATEAPVTEWTENGRVWLTDFASDGLPPARGNVAGYAVYQLPLTADAEGRCGEGPHVIRKLDDHRLVICLGPHPTEEATRYWQEVPFSSDLDSIHWLDMKGAGR